MDKFVVYIASPYTIGDVAVNVRNAIATADNLAEMGFVPYVPLLNHFWHIMFPHEYKFWTVMDLEFVKKCDVLFRLPGESKGADFEVLYAKQLGIEVCTTIEELIEWRKKRQ